MTDEEWRKVWDVYRTASGLAERERQDYIRLCGLAPELNRQVDVMLATSSASDSAPPGVTGDVGPSFAGTHLGRYRVMHEVGRGGMGFVYAAQDQELNRTVALKFLAPWLGETGIRPFLREARAASALNHPNIVTVHEVIQHGSVIAIVMELVGGASLRSLLQGPLDPRSLIEQGRQIAGALAAAHAAGVIHRDIKPENVMIRPDGLVKILDFGLARVTAAESSLSASRAVGTFRYMSPEQARSDAVGAPSDIFSLGVVLYEAAVGVHPFQADSLLESLQLIASHRPRVPVSVNPAIPHGLSDLIMAMLSKSPAARPTAAEVAQRLRAAPEEVESRPAATALPTRRWALGAAGLSLSMAGGYALLRRNGEDAAFQTILARGIARDPVFSPDGSQVAFSWKKTAGEPYQLALLPADGGEPRQITAGTSDAVDPVWSPDGSRIAFVRRGSGEGAVFIKPARGGIERRLDSSTYSPFSNMLDWTKDGRSLLRAEYWEGRPRHIVVTDADTGRTRPLTAAPPMGGDVSPRVSPDGSLIAFCRFFSQNTADLYVARPEGEGGRRLTFDGNAKRELRWSPDGKFILFKSRMKGHWGLWCVSVQGGDVKEVSLPRVPLGSFDVRADPGGDWTIVSADAFQKTSIWKAPIPAAGDPPSTPERFITAHVTNTLDCLNGNPAVSPNGLYVAFVSTRSGSPELWVSDMEGNVVIQRTSFGGPEISQPSWSPDGRFIISAVAPSGLNKLFTIAVFNEPPRFLAQGDANQVEPQWSRDGKSIWFSSNQSGGYETWRMPAGGGPPQQITHQESHIARESPDGNWLYFVGLRSGLWRVPKQGGQAELFLDRVTYELYRAWAIGRRGLYYTYKDARRGKWTVMLMNVKDRSERKICDFDFPPPRWSGAMSLSPDERWLLLPQTEEEGSHLNIYRRVRV